MMNFVERSGMSLSGAKGTEAENILIGRRADVTKVEDGRGSKEDGTREDNVWILAGEIELKLF